MRGQTAAAIQSVEYYQAISMSFGPEKDTGGLQVLAAGEKSIRKHYVLKVSKNRMFQKRNSFGDSKNASGHHGADRGMGGMSSEVWGLLGMKPSVCSV